MADRTSGKHGNDAFDRPIRRIARSRLTREARERDRGAHLADAAGAGFTPSTSVEVRFEPADERVAGLLAIPEGAEVTVRDRVLRADGFAVQLSVSRLPRELTRGTAIEDADAGPGGTYARLEEAGHPIGSFAEQVGARTPASTEAARLHLGSGAPVITITRVAYAADGTPLEVNDMVLAADRYRLHYEWPAG